MPTDRVLPNEPRSFWRTWLPSRGSVLLVVFAVAGLLVYERRADAFPALAPVAASTAAIPYQGRLADANGVPLDGSFAVTFKIYSLSGGGASLWTESWTGGNAVSVSDGLFSVLLGSLTPFPPGLFSAQDSLWLGLAVGGDAEMMPRVQLGSTPFALSLPDGAVTSAKLDAIDVFAQVDPFESTTSVTPVSLATTDIITFTLEQTQWVNIAYGTTASATAGHPAYMRLVIDGGTPIDYTLIETWGSSWTTISSIYRVQLPLGTHTITAQYNTTDGGTATYWRRKLHAYVISQ